MKSKSLIEIGMLKPGLFKATIIEFVIIDAFIISLIANLLTMEAIAYLILRSLSQM